VARYAGSNDLSGLVFGQKDVQSGKPEVPCHDKKVGKHLEKLLGDTHADGDVEDSVLSVILERREQAGHPRQDMSSLCGMYSSGHYAHYRVVPQDALRALPYF
jgi:hypothetical protein